MEDNITEQKDQLVNFSNVSSLITYVFLIGVVFTLIRFHFYYQVLLHVPIFQYMETSGFLLAAASSGTVLVIYLAGANIPFFIQNKNGFTNMQKIATQLLVIGLSTFYFIINALNDPIVMELVKWPWH